MFDEVAKGVKGGKEEVVVFLVVLDRQEGEEGPRSRKIGEDV